MFKILSALNSLLGTVLALVIVGLICFGGWFGFRTYFADKFALEETEDQLAAREAELETKLQEVRRLNSQLGVSREKNQRLARDLEEKIEELQRLETAMKLLKVNHRLARIEVISQQGTVETNDLATQFSFVEVDQDGNPMEEARVFSIEGDVVYIDAWVIKFSDKYIEEGDPLRSTSVCLFRRLFGETQRPADGFSLDPVGAQPTAYRNGGKPSELEKKLWSRFWHYANNPEEAKAVGVRALHGEAPSIKLMPGKSYRVQLRASDGLSIIAEEKTTGGAASETL